MGIVGVVKDRVGISAWYDYVSVAKDGQRTNLRSFGPEDGVKGFDVRRGESLGLVETSDENENKTMWGSAHQDFPLSDSHKGCGA